MQSVVGLQLHASHVVVRQRERTLHDEGVLAVRIVARTFPERLETERAVERLSPFVARANLQRTRARAQIACI